MMPSTASTYERLDYRECPRRTVTRMAWHESSANYNKTETAGRWELGLDCGHTVCRPGAALIPRIGETKLRCWQCREAGT